MRKLKCLPAGQAAATVGGPLQLPKGISAALFRISNIFNANKHLHLKIE